MGPFFDNRADVFWGGGEVPVRERLVNIGIRPSVNTIKVKRVVRLETSVCFPHHKSDEQPNKKPKKATSHKEEKAMTRMLWLL